MKKRTAQSIWRIILGSSFKKKKKNLEKEEDQFGCASRMVDLAICSASTTSFLSPLSPSYKRLFEPTFLSLKTTTTTTCVPDNGSNKTCNYKKETKRKKSATRQRAKRGTRPWFKWHYGNDDLRATNYKSTVDTHKLSFLLKALQVVVACEKKKKKKKNRKW